MQQRDVVVVGLSLRVALVEQQLQFGGKTGNRPAVDTSFGKRLPDAVSVGTVRGERRLVQRYRQDLHLGACAMPPRVTPRDRYTGVMKGADEPESLASESLAYLIEGRFVVTDYEVDVIVGASLPADESVHAPAASQPALDPFSGKFV
jgi:hypothetical protein